MGALFPCYDRGMTDSNFYATITSTANDPSKKVPDLNVSGQIVDIGGATTIATDSVTLGSGTIQEHHLSYELQEKINKTEVSVDQISIRQVFELIRDVYLKADNPQQALDEIDRLAVVGQSLCKAVSDALDENKDIPF